jgi:cysteine desulfurase
MHSNNETGVLQPIREVASAAHRAGALVHTDAAQSVGKVTICVAELGVDLLSLAGHERGYRPGTENVASIVGLGVACEIAAPTQSACHTGVESASSVLLAMGIPEEQAGGAVRLTLGRSTTESQVDHGAAALARSWRALLGRSSGGREWGSNPPGTG